MIKGLHLGEHQDRVDQQKDAGEWWEGAEPEGEECACARWVGGVKCRTRKRRDKGMGARGQRRDGGEPRGEGVLFAWEEGWRDKRPENVSAPCLHHI